jgi:hypothetical protein
MNSIGKPGAFIRKTRTTLYKECKLSNLKQTRQCQADPRPTGYATMYPIGYGGVHAGDS